MWQDLKNLFHLVQAIIANIYYRFPSRRLKVIGVTGTDGKTTTTHLIAHILKTLGHKVSYVSSVYASIAGKEYDIGFHVTTPSPFALQKFLKQSADNGDSYFVLETTSHALDQNRVWGIEFEIGALTNVTHEHLDYHKNYEEYFKVKVKLLDRAKVSVVNEDDESYNYLSEKLKVKSQKYNSKLKALNKLPLLTKFNQYNYSAAYTVGQILGLDEESMFKAISTFKLPKGRLELVYDKDFKVVIDFAHTPNAFENLLPEIREKYLKKGSQLIHVFGAAGLRDFTKRPMMGLVSSLYADRIILTEEDFRTEKPEKICEQIRSGIKNEKPVEVIINREQAIFKAVTTARKGDVVVLTGKSHEKSLCRGKIEFPWSEHEAVQKALNL
ncbi:UDP-N-acetylmuramoyl-L-alanyl-D-glutamate--2,6-diaminopimelate ligase [Candidatus Roizmanbacteria bacterium]|nr:UDP-N-acetylmuramoyl-L-alanyl-D-glutamate--2,6-diaminopimelate ligase [Candidatus Roizmanbacteria bacterium]